MTTPSSSPAPNQPAPPGCQGVLLGAAAAFVGLCGLCLGQARSPVHTFAPLVMLLAVILLVSSLSRLGEGLKTSSRPGARDLRRQAFSPPLLRVRPRQRCPYCHDGLQDEGLECSGCQAVYHSECLTEAGGCSTLGCRHAALRRLRR